MKPLVLFHANCNDGFGAAWVVFGQHAGIPCVYDGVRYRIIDDDQIKAVVKSPEALRVYVE